MINQTRCACELRVGVSSFATAANGNAPPQLLHNTEKRRTKIWEIAATLHCSIIGTCLTTGEIRALLRKFGVANTENATDHELHAVAVTAAGKRDALAKHIQKALDQRSRLVINQLRSAKSAEELCRYWDGAVRRAEIPPAYWAVLTHPLATSVVVRHAFGDVHMLSHLVGAANRADIRRLHQIETEKAALEEKVARQQKHLHEAIVARDSALRELQATLTNASVVPASPSDTAQLVSELRQQLALEQRRRERAEERLESLTVRRNEDHRARILAEREVALLRGELAAAERELAAVSPPDSHSHRDGGLDLDGATILYVGGRPNQIAQLKLAVEQARGQLLHHDGGIEDTGKLLPGLVNRADATLFPVDCVSHSAAQSLKRLCRQAGKPFLPLRTSGTASLLRALQSLQLNAADANAGRARPA
jgi:hypothetical protein